MDDQQTQKHRDFVSEPMGDKLVTAIAGIGDKLGQLLSAKGFSKAYNVLGSKNYATTVLVSSAKSSCNS